MRFLYKEDEQGISPNEQFNDDELDLSQDLDFEQGEDPQTEPAPEPAPEAAAPVPQAPIAGADGVQYMLVPVANLQAGQTVTVPTNTGITGGGQVGDEVLQGNENLAQPQQESRRAKFKKRQLAFREEEFMDIDTDDFGAIEDYDFDDNQVQDFDNEHTPESTSIEIELPAGVEIPPGTELTARFTADDDEDLDNDGMLDTEEEHGELEDYNLEGDYEQPMRVLEDRRKRTGELARRSEAARQKSKVLRRREAIARHKEAADVSKYQTAGKVITQDFIKYGDRTDLVSRGVGKTAGRKKEYTPRIGKSWIVSDKQPKREAPKGLPGNDFSSKKRTPSKYNPKRTGAPKNFRDSIQRKRAVAPVERVEEKSGKLDYKKLLSEGILG